MVDLAEVQVEEASLVEAVVLVSVEEEVREIFRLFRSLLTNG